MDLSCRVEKDTLANPSVIADAHLAFVVALEHGTMPYIDVVSQMDSLWVPNANPILKDDLLSDRGKLFSLKTTISVRSKQTHLFSSTVEDHH